MRIESKDELVEMVEKIGLLPFFANPVKGLSIQEMIAPGMLFGGNEFEGAWEWKGPVIQASNAAYGKFFKRKAGFVSAEWLTDFINYRRHAYPIDRGSMDAMLYEIISYNDRISSTELRRLLNGTPRHRNADMPVDVSGIEAVPGLKRSSLEGPLQRLQMAGLITIADFSYKRDRSGNRYGWGVAVYSTPENMHGADISRTPLSPDRSFMRMVEHIYGLMPSSGHQAIVNLLK